MSIANNLVSAKVDAFSFNDEPSVGWETKFAKWSGIQDVRDGIKTYVEKDFPATAKSATLAALKLGTIGAAIYGTYSWMFPEPVFINDILQKAQQDFQQNSYSSSVPASVQQLTDLFYREQSHFRNWPESAKEFVATHLNGNYPMSAAIVKHLIEQANKRDDASMKRMMLKTCKSAQYSSKGCLSALESFVHPSKPTAESLDQLMSIVSQCRKNKNEYCSQAFQEAQKQSTDQKSIDNVLSLLKKMVRDQAEIAKGGSFAESAIDLVTEHFVEKEKIAEVCEKAKGDEASASECYKHADWLEKLKYLDSTGSSYLRERYNKERAEKSLADVKEALKGPGVSLAEVCLHFKDSPKCKQYVTTIVQKLIENDLPDEGLRLLAKDSAKVLPEQYFVDILKGLILENKWDKATKVCASLLQKDPSKKIKDKIGDYWDKLLLSNEAYRAVSLLKDGASLCTDSRLDQTIEKVFSHNQESETHQLYLAAKSWIDDKSGVKNVKQVLFIIEKFLANSCDSLDWNCRYNTDNEEKQNMAFILVTKLLKAKDPKSVEFRHLHYAWRINRKEGSSYDQYDYSLSKENWQEKLSKVGYSVAVPKKKAEPIEDSSWRLW